MHTNNCTSFMFTPTKSTWGVYTKFVCEPINKL